MKKKIVLISLYTDESIGVRSIYYQLLSKGFDVYLIFFHSKYLGIDTKQSPKQDYDILIDLLKKINPQIIAISSLTFTFKISAKIIKRIKGKFNPLIVLGGVHAIIRPEECIKYSDVVCIWEGDESFPELCDKFFQGKDYSNIPNLWVKKKGKIIKNYIKPVENLNNIALPDFQSENFFYIDDRKVIRSKLQLVGDNEYFIVTGRGCPNKCTYCINEVLVRKLASSPHKGKYVRRRSVEHVIEELKLVKKHFKNIKRIRFYDDIITLDLSWLRKFSEAYRKEIGIPFWCQMHFSYTTEEAILLLKKAGAIVFNLGLESGSQRVRNAVYEKYFSNERVRDVVKIMRENKIYYRLNLIVNNPFETDEDLRNGVKFLLSLPRPLPLKLFYLINFPETKLTKRLLKMGLIEKEDASFEASLSYRASKKQPFKEDRNHYWFYIYNLISKPFIPKSLIIFLTNDKFVKNPRFLLVFFNFANKLYQLKEKVMEVPLNIKSRHQRRRM